MTPLSPQDIVERLNLHIIGQEKAKRAVAIALRNRWRRQQISEDLKNEVRPKNILMVGKTGVGKTEIARRLAKLSDAPFLKVEATKFTEVGYVGRDVEQIIRDLVEISLIETREKKRKSVEDRAQEKTEHKILEALLKTGTVTGTRDEVREKLKKGALDDIEIEIKLEDTPSAPSFEVPGMPGASVGMFNLNDIMGKMGMKETHSKSYHLKTKIAFTRLLIEEADKLIDKDQIKSDALRSVEENGIVFVDEIDKICARSDHSSSSDISREGVQRDLLPLIEGTTVATKHGPIQTDHILFIASGAFHLAKPSDLLPELQGRLPIVVDLQALTKEDFKRILTEPEASLVKQYKALLGTENLTLDFSEDGIEAIAAIASEINASVEDIGARRLHTILEKLLETLSFEASNLAGQTITINRAYVHDALKELVRDIDLSRFVL